MTSIQRSVFGDISLVHVNVTYRQQKAMFDNLSAVFALLEENVDVISLVQQQVESTIKEGKELVVCTNSAVIFVHFDALMSYWKELLICVVKNVNIIFVAM